MRRERFIRTVSAAAMALATFAGCGPQPQVRVIETLPSPFVQAPKPSEPIRLPADPRTDRQIRGAVVVVDPGHGGEDPGALARFPGHAHEKTINLEIGRRVAKLLADRGAKVTLTRDRDSYPERSDRADLAERLRADLFVSIHCNSGPADATGVIVFVYEQASPQSRRSADCVVEAFRRVGIACLGSAPEDFFVLREHSRPAILIECGFLTNQEEAGKLNTPAYRARLALTIADGVTAYFR